MGVGFFNSEFIKINNNRLAFITEEDDLTFNNHDEDVYLLIILINLRGEDYQEVGYKIYHFNSWIEGVSAYAYNNFLVTSITLWYRDFDNDDDYYYSFLFFFGYPNGTDHSINIFPYLNNLSYIGNTNEDNIYIYLKSKMKIENNLFGYEPVDKIKLVSISREILFYNISEDQLREIGPLETNSFFDEKHILKQNLYLERTNEFYYFDYQYIVKEPDNYDNTFIYEEHCGSNDYYYNFPFSNNEASSETSSPSNQLYYGRTNRLMFKLCEKEICEAEYTEPNPNNENGLTIIDREIIIRVIESIKLYKYFTKTISTKLSHNAFIEISNDMKEKFFEKDSNLAWLDLDKCTEKIREEIPSLYGKPLIILKFGASSDIAYENYVIFKIYNPDDFTEIDLSICKDINIDLYIEPKMSEKESKSVNTIVEQGYNPFDINDKFYREICTPYESPDGTDVLLDDREEYFYSQLNTITCPDNCGISSYPLDSKYLKCDCPVDNEVTLDLKHMSGDNVAKSFKSTLKNSNWKAMICYKLVFDNEIFTKNIGGIITLLLLIIYVGFFIYYVF